MSSTIPDGPGVQLPLVPGEADASIAASRRISTPVVAGVALIAVFGLIAAFGQEVWEYPVLRALNANAGRWALLDRTMHALTTRDLLEASYSSHYYGTYGSTRPIPTYGHGF